MSLKDKLSQVRSEAALRRIAASKKGGDVPTLLEARFHMGNVYYRLGEMSVKGDSAAVHTFIERSFYELLLRGEGESEAENLEQDLSQLAAAGRWPQWFLDLVNK